MNLLSSILVCVMLSVGLQGQKEGAAGRPSVEYVVVEARLEHPTPELEKRLSDIEALLRAGKITEEQASKRRTQAQKTQSLLLFGYFGIEPRIIEVQRADADSAGWSEKDHPARIRFEQTPPVRGGAKLLDTPLSSMPRKGWKAETGSVATEAKYRLHPWLAQPTARLLSVSLSAALEATRYVPASSGTTRTSFGAFSAGGSPAHWVATLSLSSGEAEPVVGLFELVDSVGKSLGRVEIERPLQPGEKRDVEMVLYEDPQTSRGLKLQSVIARTSPKASVPRDEPPSKP
jgi:hypothetical protein